MILSQPTYRRTTREGTVALLVAVLLSTMMGMVGFAVDGGMMLSEKRHAQSVADAAAMAGACVFYQNYPSLLNGNSYNLNNSSNSAARTEALAVAARNGYANDGPNRANTSQVTVNFPPNIGTGWPSTITSIYNNSTSSTTVDGSLSDGCIEVQVFYWMPRNFSTVWGSDLVKIAARAVAKGKWSSPKDGVIVLDYNPDSSLVDKGGGNVYVNGGGFVVNSSHPTAAVQITGGSTIFAERFDVTGGVSISGTGGTITTSPTADQIFSGVHPTPDPLAYLPTPTQPADAVYVQTGTTYVLTPGRYTSLPNFTNGDNIVFTGEGTYWFDTSFVANGANISMATGTRGVMLYQNSGSFSVAGSAGNTINLAGLPDGVYQDMVFWQPKTNSTNISISGNGSVTIKGTFYAPAALMTVTGNGSGSSGNTYGSQYVTYQFKAAGNGDVYINYSGPDAAKTRILCLVE